MIDDINRKMIDRQMITGWMGRWFNLSGKPWGNQSRPDCVEEAGGNDSLFKQRLNKAREPAALQTRTGTF